MAMGEPKDIEVRPSEETKTEEAKPEQAAEAAKPQERKGRAEDNCVVSSRWDNFRIDLF